MTTTQDFADLEVGYDIPAAIGMAEAEIQTPALILDLDALERNIAKMGALAKEMGVRHRAHGKMHKSVDVARLQMELGGACGICCQKVSEAEAFVRGGILDILVSNQIRDPRKIDRLARLTKRGARIIVCVDDADNVAELSSACQRHDATLECLIEIECGQERCGVATPEDAVALADAISAAPGLTFAGIQVYQGAAQHLPTHKDRTERIRGVVAIAERAVDLLVEAGHACAIVGGAGTGTFRLEGVSGVFNELQCGSYAFMDADYGRLTDADGRRLDEGEWENALFLLTSIMSHPTADRAVCDAGLKSQSVDSGLPVIFGRDDVTYVGCSDEHGVIDDPTTALSINDRLRLIPGHCDPTCNIHDWFVGVRSGVVETLWPVSARGKAY